MEQNYPNPFNPSTTVKFTLPKNSEVKLAVYNTQGEKVKELVNVYLEQGAHEAGFAAEGLSSGVYFSSEVNGAGYSEVKKNDLLKITSFDILIHTREVFSLPF